MPPGQIGWDDWFRAYVSDQLSEEMVGRVFISSTPQNTLLFQLDGPVLELTAGSLDLETLTTMVPT